MVEKNSLWKFNIYSTLEDKRWKNLLTTSTIKNHVKTILLKVFEILEIKITSKTTVELSIVLTNDENIKKLNKKFRDRDSATNVLSFPMYEKEFFTFLEKEKYFVLGDVVFSLETILREADELAVDFLHYFDRMALHSLLHLFGFDHIDDAEAEKMEKLEEEVLCGLFGSL
jgi:probable rRNA maturation factor